MIRYLIEKINDFTSVKTVRRNFFEKSIDIVCTTQYYKNTEVVCDTQ